MLSHQEMRMLRNAVRQVVVAEEGGSYGYATAISDHDTLDDFKRLHSLLGRSNH